MPEQEALIPTMKRIDKEENKIRIPFVNIALIFMFILLLIGSTFVNINIQHFILPKNYFGGGELAKNDYIYSFYIIPQIPVLMFMCSALGKKLATTCISLYFLLGMTFLPIFALGGGLGYITEYSFGYIFAYIPAILIAGNILNKKYSFLNMILAAFAAVLIIHVTGISYMALLALIKHDGGMFIKGWIGAQSGIKIIYDFILSFLGILIGKYFRVFLKFISD